MVGIKESAVSLASNLGRQRLVLLGNNTKRSTRLSYYYLLKSQMHTHTYSHSMPLGLLLTVSHNEVSGIRIFQIIACTCTVARDCQKRGRAAACRYQVTGLLLELEFLGSYSSHEFCVNEERYCIYCMC